MTTPCCSQTYKGTTSTLRSRDIAVARFCPESHPPRRRRCWYDHHSTAEHKGGFDLKWIPPGYSHVGSNVKARAFTFDDVANAETVSHNWPEAEEPQRRVAAVAVHRAVGVESLPSGTHTANGKNQTRSRRRVQQRSPIPSTIIRRIVA